MSNTHVKANRRRGRNSALQRPTQRKRDYRNLRNPFPPMKAFSDDRIEAIHQQALKLLEETGVKVLLPEARKIFARAGAKVEQETQMVFIGKEIVDAALKSAPKSIFCKAADPSHDLKLELGALLFQPGAGAPHATDRVRGRRPGTAQDFDELVQLTEHFDVLHMIPPLIEPQDVPTHLRHYFTMKTQLLRSEKLPAIFSRGTPQVMDSFEMLKEFRGLSDKEFLANSHCYTVINTNSPRTLDVPMAQGIIDFAKYRQLSIITPFTLMGAMAPITVAGAMLLSHAEALMAITLSQLVQTGAPVCYGTFTSNVDMKSGSPAFGTPEHFQASLVGGQLARLIGLPWRCASGSAANVNDSQAANENQFALWGCLLAGTSVVIHSAGWLEGGLSVSYEKLITDMEVLQMVAELCTEPSADDAELALDALNTVKPAGHFFACEHTMERYRTAFYEPLVADVSNFDTWNENGARTANERATDIWKDIIAQDYYVPNQQRQAEGLEKFIRQRTKEGGALPES